MNLKTVSAVASTISSEVKAFKCSALLTQAPLWAIFSLLAHSLGFNPLMIAGAGISLYSIAFALFHKVDSIKAGVVAMKAAKDELVEIEKVDKMVETAKNPESSPEDLIKALQELREMRKILEKSSGGEKLDSKGKEKDHLKNFFDQYKN